MADSPRKRYSRSPSPYKAPSRLKSRSRSRSRGRSPSRSPRAWSRSPSRSHSRNAAENPGNTLYVTGLSTRITERDLEDHFAKKGKVKECLLVVEPHTRISRGFAFVTMETNEDAGRCIRHLHQSVLLGRYIKVEKKKFGSIQDDEFIHLNLSLMNGPSLTSRRKRPRTPTPGNYLGAKSSRGSYRDDRSRYRGGGNGRDNYGGGYRRSPRRSPYQGGRDYSPRRSPYGGRSRRERS